MSRHIIPVYVINLDRRPDRWAAMCEQLDRLGIEAERVPAVDAEMLANQEEWECGNGRPTTIHRTRQADIGALACAWSHRKAMRAFLDTPAPAALILEDDAELAADTGTLLESTDWWPRNMLALRLETIYPAGRKWQSAVPLWSAVARTPTGRTVHRFERGSGGSAAYLLTRKGAEVVHPAFADPEHPVDQLLWNKRRSKLAHRLRPHLIAPAMARQREAGTDLAAWCDADHHVLDKTRRRRRRWAGMPHMAKVRLLMLTGLVRKPEVLYRDSIELGS